MRERIAYVYEEDGTLFGSYLLTDGTGADDPKKQALAWAIEDGLDPERTRSCRVEVIGVVTVPETLHRAWTPGRNPLSEVSAR